MAYIDWKKLKARVPIADVLTHYGLASTLRPNVKGFEGTCPFCGSKAFKVNTEKNAWFCFGECKTKGALSGGNILDFVAKKENVSLSKAATLIASWEDSAAPTGGEQETKETKEGVRATTPEPPPQGAPAPARADPRAGGAPEPLPTSQEPPTASPLVSDCSDVENKPMPFALKGVNAFHEAVAALGIPAIVAASYGAGYFTGKGIMAERVVFPFHDDLGQIVGYAGYRPGDQPWKYPPADKFNPGQAMFGLYHALNDEADSDTLVLCRTPLAALRYRAAHLTATPVAVTTDTLTQYHLTMLTELMRGRDKVLLIAPLGAAHVADILKELLVRWFVRLELTNDGSDGGGTVCVDH